jgi:hypothetical protein
VAGVVQCEAHDRLVTFASPIVERIWNGHDLSYMATTRHGASFGQDSHTRSKRQGSALHVKVSRKVPPGHMDLSGFLESLLPHGMCIDMGVPLA